MTSVENAIVQKYFQTLKPYKNATRVVGKPAVSANIDGDLLSPLQTHLVDIREFLQMTYIQQHGIKVSQLEQKITIEITVALKVIKVIALRGMLIHYNKQ